MTVVAGRVVHADGEFTGHAPAAPRASPDWSPVNIYGGYQPNVPLQMAGHGGCHVHGHARGHATHHHGPSGAPDRGFWGALGCSCWAF